MRILIVEDDRSVLLALKKGLQSYYLVDMASSAKSAHDLVCSNEYDLIILDINLPDESGFELCKELREQEVAAPIMVVTGRTDVNDKILLLDTGADDYLTKPFSLEELKARIRALLRRDSQTQKTNIIRTGELAMDLEKREVRLNGRVVQLRRKEYDLLEYMLRNVGKTVSRQMIMDHVWDMNETLWTNAIDVHIKNLRDKIDRESNSRYIKTIHGIGYKLEMKS